MNSEILDKRAHGLCDDHAAFLSDVESGRSLTTGLALCQTAVLVVLYRSREWIHIDRRLLWLIFRALGRHQSTGQYIKQ
jgi:hypothetical protein